MTTSRNQVRWRQIPLTRIIRQVNGVQNRIAVYDFGSVEKFERVDQPGAVYFWATGLRQNGN